MGLTNKIAALLGAGKKSTLSTLSTMGFALEAGWIPKSFLHYNFAKTADVIQFNSVVAACLGVLARTFAEPPLRVMDNRTGKILSKHPLADLLRMPYNPLFWGDIDDEPMSQAELMMYTVFYLGAGGNCYWRKLRAQDGSVVGLMPYHDGNISYMPTTKRRVEGYRFTSGITNEILSPREFVHVKWLSVDFQNPVKALSPIVAAAREVGAEEAAQAYVSGLLANDATPRTIFSVASGVELTDQQVERMTRTIKEKFGGKNYGSPAVLEGGMTVQRLSLGLNELQIDQLMKIPETRVAALLGVPAIVAGLGVGLDSATYSNFGQAMKVLVDYTLVPLWRNIAEQITESMRSEYSDGEYLTVEFDTSRVTALQEKENEKQARVVSLYTANVTTLNETRGTLGLPEVSGGDAFKFQLEAPSQPVVAKSSSSAAVRLKAQPPPLLLRQGKQERLFKADGDESDESSSDEIIRTKYWQRQDVHLKSQEDTLLAAIKKAFEVVEADVEKRLAAWQKANNSLSVPADVGVIVDSEAIAEILQAQTSKAVKAAVTQSLKAACEEIGENWNAVKSDFDDIIKAVVAESSSQITSAVGTVKSSIEALLAANATASEDEIKAALSKSFEAYSGTKAFKAVRIARTTATVANGKAQHEAFTKFSFAKTWLSERDDDVREDHRGIDGQRADSDGYFTSPSGAKAQYPGGFGVAAEDINCRCVIFPVKNG